MEKAGDANTDEPWLTVAIPAYNVACYIADAIHSVASQTGLSGVEILVCDDRSKDESGRIVEQLTREIPELRLITHAENSGVGAARNTLLDAARGQYLWYLDGDDMLTPGAIASLRAIVTQHAPDLVLCDFRRTFPIRQRGFSGTSGALCPGGVSLVSGVFMTRRMHPWSKIARRSLWSGVRSPVGRWFEDVTTSAQLILKAENYYYAAESWVYYRIRSDGFVGVLNRPGPFNVVNAEAFVDSLAGYRDQLTEKFGCNASVDYAVATFCGHEFANIVDRIVRGTDGNLEARRNHLIHFRAAIERNSPIAFDTLVREHGRKLALYRYWHLRGALNRMRRYTT